MKKLFLRAEFGPLWEPWEEDEIGRKIFPTVNCLHTYIEDVFAVLGINLHYRHTPSNPTTREVL